MHIPDGFLSAPVWVTLDLITLPAVAWVARQTRGVTPNGAGPGRNQFQKEEAPVAFGHHSVPLMGVMGAFIFAAQMINFPVAAGTSGHLIGGTLLSVILGPGPAVIVLTAILTLQALIFQDGGILALGANIFNMALAGVVAGYLPGRMWGNRSRPVAIFVGGVFSVVVSGMLALAELRMSGIAIPVTMLWGACIVFSVNAVLEGAITVTAVRAIAKLQPAEVLPPRDGAVREPSLRPRLLAGLGLAALLLSSFGILLASAEPDGLQKLAGSLQLAENTWFTAPFAGYDFGSLVLTIDSEWTRRALAGGIGVGMILAICLAGGRLLMRSVPGVKRD